MDAPNLEIIKKTQTEDRHQFNELRNNKSDNNESEELTEKMNVWLQRFSVETDEKSFVIMYMSLWSFWEV